MNTGWWLGNGPLFLCNRNHFHKLSNSICSSAVTLAILFCLERNHPLAGHLEFFMDRKALKRWHFVARTQTEDQAFDAASSLQDAFGHHCSSSTIFSRDNTVFGKIAFSTERTKGFILDFLAPLHLDIKLHTDRPFDF